MFGNVGCGKTTTVAYVCELLDSEEAIVCRYYCKDDGERNKVQNAYSSLIGQLLVYDPTLDEYYLKWNKNTKALDSQKQVQRPEHLRVCLVDLVRHAKRPVCIVIDALDECEETSWEELMILFGSLSNLETHCKVFLSSRHHDDIKKAIPGKTFEMSLSRDEARLIAKHILDDYFQKEHWDHISEEERQLLLEKVCGKAERSAIWIHLVLAHVNLICKDEIPQPDLERFLEVVENAPSDQAGLQDLYGKLYQQTCRAKKVEARKVEPILEFLAFADRPVKLREVTSFAVFLDQGQKRLPKALTQEDNRRTLDLIRNDLQPGCQKKTLRR
ncbi:hypothetical protein GTA08_BOTSDO00767 [Neofusicoccum parvum]|uniref:Uncharacterized protein n=1 Tax=Neofusicoccum parvum TaxID=310453 RepID=A0ACB5S543_9PEZI|nr:hypothetical protein GTA08_BOTSDO00767 [Neofusicoccum parvum]